MATTPFNEELQEAVEGAEELQEAVEEGLSRSNSDDVTRQEVAKKFVKYYFWILALIIIGIPVYNFLVIKYLDTETIILPMKDIILTYSAVVGPTVGLVIAYYFKSGNE